MLLDKIQNQKTQSDQPLAGKKKGVKTIKALASVEESYKYYAPDQRTEILWKCLMCGELKPRNKWALAPCPSCGAPKSQFVLVDED